MSNVNRRLQAGALAAAALYALWGCGEVSDPGIGDANPDPGPADDGDIGDEDAEDPFFGVRGTIHDVYVHEDGETPVPRDLADTTVEIFVENDDGGFDVFSGSGAADGRFEVEDVPEGLFYIRLPDRPSVSIVEYLHTDERDLEIVTQRRVLRPDHARPTEESTLAVDIAGLDDSNPGSNVHLTAPLQGLYVREFLSEAASTFSEDYDILARNERLLSEDDLYITQLAPVTRFGNSYRALERSLLIPDLTHADGERLEVEGELETVEQQTLTIDARGSAFDSIVDSLCPGELEFGSTALAGRAVPLGFDREATAQRIDLFESLDVPPSNDEITVSYGDPTPAQWEASVSALTVCRVEGSEIVAFAEQTLATEPLDSGTPLTPTLGPVVNISVDGQDGQEPAVVDTETPRVTWSQPSLGSAAEYSALLGYDGNSVTIFTREDEIRVPPGVIEEGRSVTLLVTSRDYPWGTEARRVPVPRSIARAVFPGTITLQD